MALKTDNKALTLSEIGVEGFTRKKANCRVGRRDVTAKERLGFAEIFFRFLEFNFRFLEFYFIYFFYIFL